VRRLAFEKARDLQQKGGPKVHNSWTVKERATRFWYRGFKARHEIVSTLKGVSPNPSPRADVNVGKQRPCDVNSGNVEPDMSCVESPTVRTLFGVETSCINGQAAAQSHDEHDVINRQCPRDSPVDHDIPQDCDADDSDAASEVLEFVGTEPGTIADDGYRSDVDMFDGTVWRDDTVCWPPLPPIPYEVWAPPPPDLSREASPEIGIRPPLPKNF